MKFHHSVLASVLASGAIASSVGDQSNLRSSAQQKKTTLEQSTCNAQTSKESCFASVDDSTQEACSWCVAGAVPSECVTQEQAKQLPEAVFECSTPSRNDDHDATNEALFESVFEFKPEKTHRLKVKENNVGVLSSGDGDDSDDAICDPSSKSISGYMDIKGSKYDEDQDKHLFFWMFEKRGAKEELDEEKKKDIPFIVWLTGGPGCSSTLALLTENGPCSVNKDGKSTTVNPNSWTEAAHVLWLDQPAGVGFSYGEENDSNEAMVSEDAYYFLQAFFQTYPEYVKSPLYIVGESYAGHYVPAIAHHIYEGNQKPPPNTIELNFAGLSIGNGLTNPEEQYKWYPEMGHNNSHGIQIFDDSVYETMKEVVPKCTALINKCNSGDSMVDEFACQSAFIVCNMGLTSPYQATGLNPYDIRIPCEKPPLCYDFSQVGKWLNLKSTKDALGVDPKHSHSWQSCNFGINMKFHSDWMHDFSKYVAVLLDAGYPALIYAGDVDFICNYLGNQAWTYKLQWSGTEGFQAAEQHSWKDKGLARAYGGLTFLQVYDAGHMVPSDQPEASLDMIKIFVNGGQF